MNLSVYQCISVHNLSIGNVSNSSVLQIGTSGKINALSHNNQTDSSAAPPTSTTVTSASPHVPLPPPAALYTQLN